MVSCRFSRENQSIDTPQKNFPWEKQRIGQVAAEQRRLEAERLRLEVLGHREGSFENMGFSSKLTYLPIKIWLIYWKTPFQ